MHEMLDSLTLDSLYRVLGREAAAYDDLLALAESQREALVARRSEALAEIAADQSRRLAGLRRLERDARLALDSAAVRLGIDPDAATLSRIVERLEPSRAEPFVTLRDHLATTADRLSRASQINAGLFEAAMDSIRFTLQLLARSAAGGESGYRHDGSSSAEAQSRRERPALLVDGRA